MNTHLTSQQISEWILGEPSREVDLHVRSCPFCQAELSQFESSLKGFRSSVRQWSEQQLSSPALLLGKRNPAWPWWMTRLGWVMAAIALCIFIGHLSEYRASQPQVKSGSIADTALLTQIDRELSQTVPGPMEPLTQLVSWDANSSASTSGKFTSESQAQ
jgi:hypothetical protein